MYIKNYMPAKMRDAIEKMGIDMENVREIRIRIGQPIRFEKDREEIELLKLSGETFVADRELIDSIFEAVNDYSLYAHADSIRQGFITVRGGHRIGFVGQAVLENGLIKNICHISSINIRISHQVKGVSNGIVKELFEEGQVLNTLIISPPGFGKTTLLRDLVRNISNGYGDNKGVSVSVIDERSEIAASYKGIPENDLGTRCDVFDNVPKAQGMMLALRTMAPKVIAVDEIGTYDDVESIQNVCRCGCSVIATAHGNDKEDLMKNPSIKKLIEEECFKRFVVIGKDGTSCVHI